MKNIKNFIFETKMDIPEKEKDQLILIVSSLIEGFYSEGDDDIEKFVKDKLKNSHWSKTDLNNLVNLCKETLKKTESHLEKILDKDDED